MNEPLVEIFLGDIIEDRGELRVLNRLRGDLERRGIAACVFANFVATGAQLRQIDLLVSTRARLVHAELKVIAPELPLVGRVNGRWQQVLPDGQRREFDRNFYWQAHQGTYAISDAVRTLVQQRQVPDARPFYRHIDTVVCLYPVIPAGSQLEPYAHVDVVGYDDLLVRLTVSGPCPPWTKPHWEAFARGLGVFREVQESAAEQTRRADAAVVADYRRFFRSVHSVGLHELVAVPAEGDGRRIPQPDVVGPAADQGTVVVLGPSGIGKTHATRHAAISLTDDGHVVVWLRCAEYEPGRFGVLLARAVAPFTTEPALEFLRKAVDTGSSLVVVLDGFNECPSELRPQLLEQLGALRLRVPLGLVITSSVPPDLPAPLAATTVRLCRPDAAERAAILASYGLQEPGVVGDAFQTPYELAIAAECYGELGSDASQIDLLDAYVRRRAGTVSVRAALRCLAATMSAGVRGSLTVAEAMAALQRHPEPAVRPAVIDEALSCPLLVVRQGRVSFVHELLGRFLAAEDLVVRSATGSALGRLLTQPQHADLRTHALFLELDHERRHDALMALADVDLLTDVALGKLGDILGAQVHAEVGLLLAEAASATVGAEIDLETADIFTAAWRTARVWSPAERALLAAAGRCLRQGLFVREVAALLDRTDEVCSGQATRLRSAGHRDPVSAVVAFAYAMPRTDTPDCLPASIIVKACNDTRFGRRSDLSDQPAAAEMFTAGSADPSWGRLYAAALLCSPFPGTPIHPHDAALLPDLLRAAWIAGGYHLRLRVLEVVYDAARGLDDPTQRRMADVLNDLDTDNLWLRSSLVEALAAYGQLKPGASLADIHAQVSEVLAGPDDPEAWASAGRIVASQFEDQAVLGPYGEAIGNLPERDRVRLFVMAVRAPDSEFYASYVLGQIADSAPSIGRQARQVLRDAATRLATHTPSVQHAITAHLEGLRGWARISDQLPPAGTFSHDPDRQAWRQFDELIFRLERGPGRTDGIDPAQLWSVLLGECASAAVDVMYQLSHAAIVGPPLEPAIHERLVQSHPDEIRRLLEWGLAHRDELTSCFPRPDPPQRARYIMQTLGHVGTTTTAVLLRGYLADPELGSEAVTAIRRIEQRNHNASQ
jgi:hypothetical protein